jgi:ferrous iron transport protein B
MVAIAGGFVITYRVFKKVGSKQKALEVQVV